ncbi:MAG: hypothetical protein ACI4UF_02860, partial [Thermoguttaceae bacterium]
NAFMSLGDTIAKTSQRVGIGTDTLGGLKFAAEQCGADFETLTNGIKAFQNTLGAASMGDERALNKLGKVGLKAGAFTGLDNTEQLKKVANYIKSIGDKAEQTRVSIALFGDAGFKLLPFFQEGAEGIKKLIDEGKDIGAVMGEEATESAVALTDAMNRLKTSASGIPNVFIANLAPALSSAMDHLTSAIKVVSKFTKDYAPFITAIGTSIGVFAAWKAGIIGVTTALPALIAGFKALGVAVMTNPILAGGAVAIGAIVGAWMLWNKHIAETEKRLYSISNAAEKHTAEMEKAHAADQALFDRLQELADIEDPLSNAEIQEANALIAALTDKYGDLGLEIDKDTGKINGMAEAQRKMLEEQRRQKIAALEAEAQEHEANSRRLQKKIDEKTSYKARVTLQGYWTESAMQEDFDRMFAEQQKAMLVRQQLRTLRGDDEDEEEDAASQAEEPVEEEVYEAEDFEQMKQNSVAERARLETEKAEAQKELAGMEDDPDLDFRDPLTKAYADLEAKAQEKYAALDRRIELTRKAGGEGVEEKVAELEAEYAKIEQWRLQEQEKIGQGVIDERQKQADEEYAQWRERNPELEKPEQKDARIVAAEASVQAARDAQAEAIMTGVGLPEADAELKAAQENMAKTIAEVSGEARQKAKEDWNAAQEAYDKAKANGADNKTLNDLLQVVKEAQAKYEQENEAYFGAVGSLRKETEEDVQDAVMTTLSSSGTFSAYGMDAVATSDIPQQTLEVLRKLLDDTNELVEEKKNDGAFSK